MAVNKIILFLVVLVVVAGLLFLLMNIYGRSQEPDLPKTEIRVKGFNSSMTIAPSVDSVVSGIVTITVTEAPEGTNMVFFAIQGRGADIKQSRPNLGIDNDGSDGWSRFLDTAEYENGLYNISGLSMSGPDSNPLGAATAQVIIQN